MNSEEARKNSKEFTVSHVFVLTKPNKGEEGKNAPLRVSIAARTQVVQNVPG